MPSVGFEQQLPSSYGLKEQWVKYKTECIVGNSKKTKTEVSALEKRTAEKEYDMVQEYMKGTKP